MNYVPKYFLRQLLNPTCTECDYTDEESSDEKEEIDKEKETRLPGAVPQPLFLL